MNNLSVEVLNFQFFLSCSLLVILRRVGESILKLSILSELQPLWRASTASASATRLSILSELQLLEEVIDEGTYYMSFNSF